MSDKSTEESTLTSRKFIFNKASLPSPEKNIPNFILGSVCPKIIFFSSICDFTLKKFCQYLLLIFLPFGSGI